jgi:hypothetical protein
MDSDLCSGALCSDAFCRLNLKTKMFFVQLCKLQKKEHEQRIICKE